MGHNVEGTKKKKWVLPVVIVVIIALIIGIVFAVLRFRGAGAGDDMYGMDDDFYVDDSYAGVGASNYYSGIVEAQETQEVLSYPITDYRLCRRDCYMSRSARHICCDAYIQTVREKFRPA